MRQGFECVNLRNKRASYFTSKMGVFRTTENCNSGHCKLGKTTGKSHKADGCYCMEKKEKVGRGCFERKSMGEKQEFRVTVVSPWLICRGSGFLIGDTMYIFSSWGQKLLILSC